MVRLADKLKSQRDSEPDRVVETPVTTERVPATQEATTPWRQVEGELAGPADKTPEGRYPVGDLQQTVWDRHPGEYGPPTAEQREALTSAWERSANPDSWAQYINPDKDNPGRRFNCADCTRAGESTWRGNPQVAAERLPGPDGRIRGESPSRIEDWAGDRFQPASMKDIGERLDRMGPGSSALVAVKGDWGGGHAINGFNEGGTVQYRDFQRGTSGDWPPPWKDSVVESWAIYRGPEEER